MRKLLTYVIVLIITALVLTALVLFALFDKVIPIASKSLAESTTEPKNVLLEEEVVVEPAPTNEELIIEYSAKYGAKTDLALKVAWCESRYENVCNGDGCEYGQGIFQIIPSTWENVCEGNVMNEKDNINCGTRLIAQGEISRWGTPMSEWGTYHCFKNNL